MPIAFTTPFFLLLLLGLPLLVYLLRATPPLPRVIALPTARFLMDIQVRSITPARMPLWLIILRLSLLATIILMLAGPYHQRHTSTEKLTGNIQIVIENDWTATASWTTITDTLTALINRVEQDGGTVTLFDTTPLPGERQAKQSDPLSPAAARASIPGRMPQPFPSAAATLAQRLHTDQPVYWIGTGYATAPLPPHDHLTYINAGNTAPLYRLSRTESPDTVRINTSRPLPVDTRLPITLYNSADEVIGTEHATLRAGFMQQDVSLPSDLLKSAHHIRIDAGPRTAAGTLMLDGLTGRRSAYILSPVQQREGGALVDPAHYLRRALEPFATLTQGADYSAPPKAGVVFAPDLPQLDTADVTRWRDWITAGGILVRFAGPQTMDASTPDLLPVTLRAGGRRFDGLSATDKRPAPAAIPSTSPLFPVVLPDTLQITEQALAQPAPDLTTHIWAALDDGTPLVTGRMQGKGMIILVHLPADPQRSPLPLDGSYVDLMKRLLALSGTTLTATEKPAGTDDSHMLSAIAVVTATGQIQPSEKSTAQIPATGDLPRIDSFHPSGLYARNGFSRSLNLGEQIDLPAPISLPATVRSITIGALSTQVDLRPPLATIAILLLGAEALALIFLYRAPRALRLGSAAIVTFLILLTPAKSHADQRLDNDKVNFAYVSSGNPASDASIRQAFGTLSTMLANRTAINVGRTVAINPDTDDPAIFAFVYWPLDPGNLPRSARALERWRAYVDHGGMIFFDLRDGSTTSPMIESLSVRTLRGLLNQLGTSALTALPNDHVLNRSFYLLPTGTAAGNAPRLYIESQASTSNDGVSSVIVGSMDWAHALAAPIPDGYLTGATKDQENSIRFGINLTLYALTGNYKADQVHIPFILDRLGAPRRWEDVE